MERDVKKKSENQATLSALEFSVTVRYSVWKTKSDFEQFMRVNITYFTKQYHNLGHIDTTFINDEFDKLQLS